MNRETKTIRDRTVKNLSHIELFPETTSESRKSGNSDCSQKCFRRCSSSNFQEFSEPKCPDSCLDFRLQANHVFFPYRVVRMRGFFVVFIPVSRVLTGRRFRRHNIRYLSNCKNDCRVINISILASSDKSVGEQSSELYLLFSAALDDNHEVIFNFNRAIL